MSRKTRSIKASTALTSKTLTGFFSPVLADLDDRFDYGEDRWIGLGLLEGRVVQVVYTEPDDETRRIISVRKALRDERKQYEQFFQDQLGAS